MVGTRRRLGEAAERVNPVTPVHIWRSPAGAAIDIVVVTHLSVYTEMVEHAARSLPDETGGFLIGRVAHDGRSDECWLVEVEELVPVEPIAQNPMHFLFTWRDVDRVRSYREQHGKALVGWYHTHPDLGVFLSDTDLERTHRVLFSEPFQVALVYDPVRGRAGYFFWEGAQQIDAGQAEWREFAIAVASPEPSVEGADPGPGEPGAPPGTASSAAEPAVTAAPVGGDPAPGGPRGTRAGGQENRGDHA